VTTLPRNNPRRHEAGAVNALWVIMIVILWLGTLAMLYSTSSDIARHQDAAQAARTQTAEIEARYDTMNEAYSKLSEAVGYRELVAGSKSDAVTVAQAAESVRAALGPKVGLEGTAVTLEQAVTALMADRQAAWAAQAQAETDHQTAVAQRAAAEKKADDLEAAYKTQVAALNTQLADAQAAADQQARNDQGRIDEIVAQNDTLDAAARQAQQDLDAATEAARKEVARKDALLATLAIERAPVAPAEPDGRILEVGEAGRVGWIDLGGAHGLPNGTRFELLRRGRSGELQSRGTVEVRIVNADTSLVAMVGEVKATDPMLPGDLVRSVTFSKEQVFHFYLLGEFPLSLSKEFVTQRLGELGAKVDDTLTATTDVLVLGNRNLAEGESAPELTATDEFRLARDLGMRIVRLDELAPYLRY